MDKQHSHQGSKENYQLSIINCQLSRREFLRNCGRYTVGGAIGILTAALVHRRVKAGKCSLPPNQCRRCGELNHCELPQALTARRKRNG